MRRCTQPARSSRPPTASSAARSTTLSAPCVRPATTPPGRGNGLLLLQQRRRRRHGTPSMRTGCERVAVIDCDVHHGNGTEDIMAGNGRVLMASFSSTPFTRIPAPIRRPTTWSTCRSRRHPRRRRARAGRGAVAAAAGGLRAADDLHLRRLRRAPRGRPRPDRPGRGGLCVDHAEADGRRRPALEGAHRRALEGGYNLSSLARSVAAHVRTLAQL